jgi:S1-C subfamily serine protease
LVPPSGPSPVLYAALGAGGVALVGLVAMVIVLSRSGPVPAGDERGDEAQSVAEAPSETPVEPAAAPVVEPAAAPAVEPAVVASVPASSSGKSAIDSADVARRLKEATVYIKNTVAGRTLSSGTGFVIEVQGDAVIVATNRHVAVVDLSEVPERFLPKGSATELEVVFRSGQGPQNEQALPAQIMAADTTDDLSTDLAFLRVNGVKRPPTPINPLAEVEPTEGMPYNAGGFPFGGMLGKVSEASSRGNPSVSITGGRIAALRRDDHGQILLLQVDGSLQPGNSGGPIVDEKTGKLLGVAVAKTAMVDTIGLVVPAEQLRKALAGRVGAVVGTRLEGQKGVADLEIKAQVVDPKGLVQGVVVHVAAASSARTIAPNSDGSWPPLPNTKPVELMKDDKAGSVSGRVQVNLPGEGAQSRKVLIQTAHRDRSGKLVYSKPKEYELPEKGSFGRGSRLQKLVKVAQRRSANLLGPLIDPDKDCTLTRDEDNLKIKIEIPGKLHSLAPELTLRTNRKKSLHNAPMTLTEVEGDFAALVEVTGEINPGTATPKDRQGHYIPFTVQSAGLILYQDRDNFFRLERAGSLISGNLTPVHRLIIEAVKEGKQAMNPIYIDVPERDTLLILMRRKGRVRCLFSPNGGETMVAFQEFSLDLPSKVKVGLTAGNISAKPFNPTFEKFAILNDTTMIDEEFGESDKSKP